MEAIATRRPLLRDNMDGGTHVEVFDCTVLPFSMAETGEAWWEVWHEFRGQCGHDKTDDVVAESFGLEIRDVETGTSATFYVQQILHRYVNENHVLYVWNMYTEPFLFKNSRVHGIYYREQSYVLVKPVEMHEEATPCSQMVSSEDIKVEFLDPTTKKDARIAALTKHMAKSMAPYIIMRNEAIETFLLDRALQSRT
ncbi:hypothetical protein P3T76_008225 [Phytophthora citrophthora]|uniref:Uncharacterized protein n=1 Tax=Phytophthora citrophthora TaxID=4793 RepID=A0AAD9GK14_9STRA|nr:hypothetical protein P3T76_008225 [Phytophthora citrophthora]